MPTAGLRQGDIAQGGGEGGGASAAPAGYIEIANGNGVFQPIRDRLATLVAGLAARQMARRLFRRRTIRRGVVAAGRPQAET